MRPLQQALREAHQFILRVNGPLQRGLASGDLVVVTFEFEGDRPPLLTGLLEPLRNPLSDRIKSVEHCPRRTDVLGEYTLGPHRFSRSVGTHGSIIVPHSQLLEMCPTLSKVATKRPLRRLLQVLSTVKWRAVSPTGATRMPRRIPAPQ